MTSHRIYRRLFCLAAASLAGVGAARGQTPSGDTAATFARVQQAKKLRVAAFPGAEPYFRKDLATGTWTGVGVTMAADIAQYFDPRVEFVASTYGNAVLDLQASKIDVAFAMNPTPSARFPSISARSIS